MDFAYRSDIGQQREENEDYVGFFKIKRASILQLLRTVLVATRGRCRFRDGSLAHGFSV